MMHEDLKDRSERSSQTKMAALGRDNERLDPSGFDGFGANF